MRRIIKSIIIRLYILCIVIIPAFFYYLKGYITFCGLMNIGDICYQLSYVDDYKDRTKKKIRVLCLPGRERVFVFYPAVDKVSVVQTKVNNFILSHHIYFEKNKLFLCLFAFPKPDENVLQYFKRTYCANELSLISFPSLNNSISGQLKANQIKDSVLLIPSSNFYKSDKIADYLAKLSCFLKENGSPVFINSDVKIDGVVGNYLYLNLSELLENAKFFRSIVGIRTGLLDFLVNSNANIICLYDKSPIGIRFKEKEYSLHDWKGSSIVHEYYVEDLDIKTNKNLLLNIIGKHFD